MTLALLSLGGGGLGYFVWWVFGPGTPFTVGRLLAVAVATVGYGAVAVSCLFGDRDQ